jgi:predicted DNA-binding transcriptional regulator YafY
VHARYAQKPGEPRKKITYDPMLAIQRIEKARLTDQAFRRPPDYDFEKVMNQGFGVWAQKKFRVVLELSGWAADYARERVWSPEQTIEEFPEGKIRLGFWATSEPEVLGLVLSFGADAFVLEPERLVGMVRQSAAGISERYF